jgi:hypothetical protein
MELCQTHAIPCTIAMIFGLPGETDDSLSHSIGRIKQYPAGFLRSYEYTVGGRIYQGTPLCRRIEREDFGRHLYGNCSHGYVAPYYYCSPRDPLTLNGHIQRELGYPISTGNPFDPDMHASLAIAFMMDHGESEQAVQNFLRSSLAICSRSFDYLFRKLSNDGRTSQAMALCHHFLSELSTAEPTPQQLEQMERVRFYMGLIES